VVVLAFTVQDAAVLDSGQRGCATKYAARQQKTQARKEQALEIKRAAVLAAEAAAERRMKHKHEVRS
jgi:tRNA G26 N,N-dimethylase Trm1